MRHRYVLGERVRRNRVIPHHGVIVHLIPVHALHREPFYWVVLDGMSDPVELAEREIRSLDLPVPDAMVGE